MENGPKIRKCWSPEPGNKAFESSRRRRNNGGLRFVKFNFQKFWAHQKTNPNRQPKIRNN